MLIKISITLCVILGILSIILIIMFASYDKHIERVVKLTNKRSLTDHGKEIYLLYFKYDDNVYEYKVNKRTFEMVYLREYDVTFKVNKKGEIKKIIKLTI